MSKSKKSVLVKRQGMAGLVFMIPWLIGILVFTAFPMLYSMWLSVCNVDFRDGIGTEFAGFVWYHKAFRVDPNFSGHLINALKFMGFLTPMILVVSVLFAVLLNKALPGRSFFRALFFFPVVFINGPVMDKLIGNDATAIITPAEYYFYEIIETLPAVFSVPLLYIFDNIVIILWFSGIQILIMLSALQKVSDSLYEAASIDGASKWQVFWKITLPTLRPMLLVAAVYTIVDLSNYSGNAITGYINTHLNDQKGTYSYSSAMSWIYAGLVLLLLGAAFLILRERKGKQK